MKGGGKFLLVSSGEREGGVRSSPVIEKSKRKKKDFRPNRGAKKGYHPIRWEKRST